MGLFSLYLAQGAGGGLLYLSPDPSFDLAFLRTWGIDQMGLLTPPLPAGIAAYLLTNIKRKYSTAAGPLLELPESQVIRQFCFQKMRSLDYPVQDPAKWVGEGALGTPAPGSYPVPGCENPGELEMLLDGRLFSLQEIAGLIGFKGERGRRGLQLALQELCLTGRAVLIPALFPLKGSVVQCQRCGWEGIPEPRPCRRCGSSRCCICPECRLMGPLSFCDVLYTARAEWMDNQAEPRQRRGYLDRLLRLLGCEKRDIGVGVSPLVCGAILPWASAPRKAVPRKERVELPRTFRMEVRLTPPQRAAARALQDFGAQAAAGRSCLVWAACGAGKTEVSFPLIGQALCRGDSVLFATPRRDVVLEIAPRLSRVFGEGTVVPLYGGSGNLGQEAPLVVATTHQTLRFYHKFDLVILDEGDAFPYPGSRMLHFGVERALRSDGKLVYLTATPAAWMIEGAGQDKVDIIKIPARPHRFPLPEPRFLTVNPFHNDRGVTLLHRKVLDLVAFLLEEPGARLFIFVPSVALTAVVAGALRAAVGKPPLESLRQDGIQWSHAGDRQRDQKRKRFFDGEFPIFVTTTIMERGVTVSHVQVLVLGADQEMIFNTPTLVQIAGRCGRSPEYPTGEVLFVACRISRSMREARAQIRSFNEEARRKGYLRPELSPDL